MALPTTLQDIKTYIAGLGSFPVDRSKQLFYGYTDSALVPLVQFGDFKQDIEYVTSGPQFYNSTFSIYVTAVSNEAAFTLANQLDPLFAMQAVTTKTMLCLLTGYQVLLEELYKFRLRLDYSLQESA